MKSYNTRVIVGDDGSVQLGWVSQFVPNKKTPSNPKGDGGCWADRSPRRLASVLNKCEKIGVAEG